MKYTLRILRGDAAKQYWESFSLEYESGDNVISALMAIQKNPVNCNGEKTTPVSWEQGCLEEVCGSCSMLINGRPRQSCTALLEPYLKKSNTITLAPLTKFPLVKDLQVDRSSMFRALQKIKGWIGADGTQDQGFGPKVSPEVQEKLYVLSTCMTCGCCTESCPQMNDKSKFIGPAAISQVRLFNGHPTGKLESAKRTRVLMEEGGVAECGNAQNCQAVCPKGIPLTESIAEMGHQTTRQAINDMIRLPDDE